jgi:tetratricopeptide (TPR) repeat protein
MIRPPPLDVCMTVIVTLTLVECYEELQQFCEDLLAEARRRGSLQELVVVSSFRAWGSADCGALADAEADARWALERGAEGTVRMHAATELIRVLVERDDLQAAEEVLDQLVDPLVSHHVDVVQFLVARGQLRAAQGRLQEALDDFLECGRRCARLGVVTAYGAWRGEAALIHSALGTIGEARRLAREQLELARVFGRPRTLGISLRACGLVEGGDRGHVLLEEAAKTLESSRSRLELARARSDYGAALRRAGRRVQARAELERAPRPPRRTSTACTASLTSPAAINSRARFPALWI